MEETKAENNNGEQDVPIVELEKGEEEKKRERRKEAILKTLFYNQKLLEHRNQKSPFHLDKNTRTAQVIPSFSLPPFRRFSYPDSLSLEILFPATVSPFEGLLPPKKFVDMQSNKKIFFAHCAK